MRQKIPQLCRPSVPRRWEMLCSSKFSFHTSMRIYTCVCKCKYIFAFMYIQRGWFKDNLKNPRWKIWKHYSECHILCNAYLGKKQPYQLIGTVQCQKISKYREERGKKHEEQDLSFVSLYHLGHLLFPTNGKVNSRKQTSLGYCDLLSILLLQVGAKQQNATLHCSASQVRMNCTGLCSNFFLFLL